MDNSTNTPLDDELEQVEENNIQGEPENTNTIEESEENSNIGEEADVEGTSLSPVQVAPTGETNPLSEGEDNPMLFVELGDRVVIDSKKYGRTIGQVYYRSLDLIRIKPDGVSNMLHEFELEQTDEEELYREEDGVTAVYVIEKRMSESFVEQQDLRINQIIDTFDKSGQLYKTYKVVEVNKENDFIKIQDEDDEENIYELNFNFTGIEPDEDFVVISIRELVGETDINEFKESQVAAEEEREIRLEGELGEEQGQEQEEEEEVEIVGFVEITKPKIFREAEAYEQLIPDDLQKVDALNDFISGLDPILQKDPKSLRAVRVLVETLFNLKQSTIAYNEDGSIRGTKEISATTLADLIRTTHIPLGRPVLNISKKIYTAGDNDEGRDEEQEDIQTDSIYKENFSTELSQMVANISPLVSSTMEGAKDDTIIPVWNNIYSYLKQYLSPWSENGTAEPLWKAMNDTEFFRTLPPEVEENDNGKNIFIDTIPGIIPPAPDAEVPEPILDEIPFGIERALSITYRKGDERRKQVWMPEDKATMNSYLLFPSSAATYIGSTRSNSLAIDSGRSQMLKKSMRELLLELGGSKEVGTSADIIRLDVEGTTLGNIPLKDYLEGISIPALGIGDTYTTLEQYGMTNIELTPDIINTLLTKIELYQSQLLTTIAKLRTIISGETSQEIIQNPLIENPHFLEEVRSQPTLVEYLQEYERTNPTLAHSDIGKVVHLMKREADYFQVAAGKSPVLIAKALLQSNNAKYLESLRIASILKNNQLNSGEKPQRNTCKHVADLVAVRRIFDDTERFQRLTDFFRKYQGQRDSNWIDCNLCKEHLLCIHERLQLQAFLNPKEKNTLEKEIILNFSGGQFQGKYICRNCGQAIRDLDFDNNIEFDDNGKPKSGRAVLVDEDAVFDEQLDILTGVPIESSQPKQLELEGEDKNTYNIIREIAERVGINIDSTGYKTIIERTNSFVNKFPARAVYEDMRRKRPTLAEYDVALARNIISAGAVFLLLEIQTKIPAYTVRYALIGCKSPGFDGFPLDTETSHKQGIEYIACAISSIRRDEAPWNQTGFQKTADDVKRQQNIVIYIENVLKQILGDAIIQSQLSQKRKYLSEIIGTDYDKGRPKDVIPATFLPEQIMITPEVAAANAITPEVAANMGAKGQAALVKLWIRQAHLLAKRTASLVKGSPLVETTCCLANIEAPGTFWKSASDLPPIPKRILIPNQQGQFLLTEFNPREAGSVVAEPDKELYYRIFLKCCFQGPRMGYSHEPGLTNMCPWCGFQFPTIPSVMDTDTEGKSALASQNVETNTQQFTELLDKIHNVNKVIPLEKHITSSVQDIMNEFSSIVPPPIKNWDTIINDTTNKFLQLPPDADRSDIAIAAGDISEATRYSEENIEARFGKAVQYITIINDIIKLPWTNFFQVLQSYFVIPLSRLVTDFNPKSLTVPVELVKELSVQHVQKDIQPILDNDTIFLALKGDDIKKPKYNFARAKIQHFLKQMSSILPYKDKIRPIVLPGRDTTLTYIQRTLLYGPLSTLLNPSEIPEWTQTTSNTGLVGDPSMKYLLDIIAFLLNKYKRERLTFNDQEIKEMIAVRNEKERVQVVAEFDKLSDEERAIELMKKKLGIGKWAVGGTKLIYAYDKDYYDLEREKRIAAGISDFPGGPQGELPMPEGRETDEFGFRMYGDEEFERDGGYDHNQGTADDA